MAEGRVVLGEQLTHEEGIALAQLVNQPGWKILVRIIAEACRRSTEAVVKVKPGTPNRAQIIDELQSVSFATNSFATQVLDSVKLHQRKAVQEAQRREKPAEEQPEQTPRFRMPIPKLSDADAALAAESEAAKLRN